MSGFWFYTDPIDRLHQQALQNDRAARFRPPPNTDKNLALARRAEAEIMQRAGQRGYRSAQTTHKAPFDLWIEGVRVEVKAATWREAKNGARYQACIRQHQADILIFDCINGTDHFFIIPMAEITPRRNIAVWSYDPADYSGQWTPYLEAWPLLDQAVSQAGADWQPPLL